VKRANGHPTSKLRRSKRVQFPKSDPAANVRNSSVGSRSEFELRALDFILWQVSDSALPTGGFAHSAGLEAAWQHGEVPDRAALIVFCESSLVQLGRASLPFVMAAFDTPTKLSGFDALCDAFTTNHVANRASRAQGRAFLVAVTRIFPEASSDNESPPPCAHFAPVFGACLRRLDVPRDAAARLFFFQHLRGILGAAVRLNIIGPMDAQVIQRKLLVTADHVRCSCENLTVEEVAQTAPLLDLWQSAQDRLYSRLFQS